MVATFHLHYLGRRIKYGNLEVGNTIQQLLSTKRPCCCIEFIVSFLFWVILVTYNIGIYICIFIKLYSFFLLSSTEMFFLHFMLNILRYKKIFLWNWWVDCFIARFIKSCDISGCVDSASIFPFMEYFFSQETCVSFGFLVSCLSLSQSA